MKDWHDWSRQLSGELSEAGRAGFAVRIHVGGDFLRGAEWNEQTVETLDRAYLAAVLWAFRRASPRPAAWVYTHAWRWLGARHREALERVGIETFASVHTPEDGWEARGMGFRLAIDGGERPTGRVPAWSSWVPGGIPALVCPEQRLGHEKIDCSSCRYCFRRGGDVMFMRHGPGTKTEKTGAKHVE